jgi:nitrate reductase / nitrite oxidoreductase, alpha subunit
MADETVLSRRSLLRGAAMAGAALGARGAAADTLRFLLPMQVDNPLAYYPDRDWERTYRNILKPDSSFVFLCAPNDTHNCLLRAFVKNDVVVRIGPTYGYGKATDLYGNQASHRWDPRICQKGLALVRRFYGDRRVKAPMVRRGFRQWVEAGFPRDLSTGAPPARYFARGRDRWDRISWTEAYQIAARAFENIARTYSHKQGHDYLSRQGYDPAMIAAMEGAGTETIKVRGGMAFLGATRIYGLYRFANMLALLDASVRGVGADRARGARGWDSYSWHTDLPPGHPMVTGAQTNDFDLFATEKAKLILAWGMNWITTKMPDAHWLTEARLKGAKTVAITVEYSATASKCDDAMIIRPGTDGALALGMAQVLISQRLFDADWVARNTDLPFLVRMDTLEPLRPADVGLVSTAADGLDMIPPGQKSPAAATQREQFAPEALRADFQPYVVARGGTLHAVSREQWGKQAPAPDLRARKRLRLASGTEVEVRTVFSLTEEYLQRNFTPKQTAGVTGTPATAIVRLAQEIARHPETTLFVTGMGPNQFYNSDLKDRAIFLVAALTRNIGFPGGNVGSYAGNYRIALFSGIPSFGLEDPFAPQTEADGKATVKKYTHYESLHYFNYGDRPLRVGNEMFTGDGHMPAPTKAMWLNNSNSVIGNVKWHYDVVVNTLPKIEFIAFSDWWWTGSCEYADLVFAVDSWAEFKHADMTASCTNPFLQVYPRTPLPRIFDTRSDIEVIAGVARALGQRIGEPRMSDMWKFVNEGRTEVYLQRILDTSPATKGYRFSELEQRGQAGIPALMNNRSYPRGSSFEQARGEQPWHTKSGRLEFYRFEPEFRDSGENLVVYREPIDSTPYEPNVIVAHPHPAIRPKVPADYGLDRADLSCETRQVRHVLVTPEELLATAHPLRAQNFTHVYHTPKYRHGAHTTPVDTDFTAVLFGPFGDVYRHDRRMPSDVEGYVDMNPLDARELGVEDGDYVWIDADPQDRPFRGAKPGSEDARVARLLLRCRYYPGTPRGVARTWHNMYGATYGSVAGAASRADGLARNPETNYQAMYRTGSHQSATRAWLKPTLMTETLVHKDAFGQGLAKGFAPDIHCPVGAPREAFVKISRAEAGGLGGEGMWRPAQLGYRPTYENAAMRSYLVGGFVKKS